MFNQLFTCPRTIERHRAAPLVEERRNYLVHCADQGHTKSSLRQIARYLLVFVEYLPLTTTAVIDSEQVQAAAERWLDDQHRLPARTNHWYGKSHFIADAQRWLDFLGRLQRPDGPHRPAIPMIEEYVDHMAREQGLSPYTIRVRRWYLEQFFGRLQEHQRDVSNIGIADIDAAIARKGVQDGYARTSMQAYITVLRSFFRYAEHRGWCQPGLAAAILSPRVFADTTLPKGPTWDEVQRLLASINGDRPKDIRDRAIILLFAVYGLRVGEVRALCLDDLDWEEERIYVTRPKSRRRQTYPLVYTVGEALLRYVRTVRARSSYRNVFLTLRAPRVPLGSGALYDVVADRLRPLALALPHQGPHALRHACATRLLGAGLSMPAVAEHLGHRRLDTTRGYAKVDLAGLRQVADVDLGALL